MWALAPSLETLRDQVNNLAPNRSKRSDGTIGDAAHAATKSDHNPDAGGIVRALDITHDPAGGLDVGALAAAIVASRDRRVKYLIYDRRVIGQKHWTWTPYAGADPHTSHLHLSVVADDRANSTAPWAMPTTTEEMIFMAQLDAEVLEQLAETVQHNVKSALIEAAQRKTPADRQTANALREMTATAPVDIAAIIAGVKTVLPAGTAVTDDQLERALRNVLGSVDEVGQ